MPAAFRLWIVTVLFSAVIMWIVFSLTARIEGWLLLLFLLGGLIVGLPVFFVLLVIFNLVENRHITKAEKEQRFCRAFALLTLVCTVPFVFFPAVAGEPMATVFLLSATVPVSATLSYLLQHQETDCFFTDYTVPSDTLILSTLSNRKISFFMQTSTTLTKGIITALLILLMLIPTFFISNIVSERKYRQAEVVREVSGKWAAAQNVSGYFLYIPYEIPVKDVNGKTSAVEKQLIILPESARVQSVMQPEVRPRSIYKVL
ncbi:MAG: inner membrane CreD family protein, partial [Flavihumibacter sp.]